VSSTKSTLLLAVSLLAVLISSPHIVSLDEAMRTAS
jgi:hypothetical protein